MTGNLDVKPPRSAWSQELGLASCLWLREMLRFGRERARWAGAVLQPLLFWLIIGSGMSSTFRIPGAENVSSLQYFFPGILVMIILFTTIFTTISVVEDRQQGFLQAVLVAPGSRVALVVGKVAGVVTLTLIQCLVFLALAPVAGFPVAGISWWRFVAVVTVAATGLTAMNFTIAWILNSVQAYHAIMSVVLIPSWFLSGALFPRPASWLGKVMLLNPLTYAVEGIRSALSPDSLGVRSFGTPLVLMVLVVYSVVATAVAAFACRRGSARAA